MWPDLINGSFELVGAYFTWRNWMQLRQDRTIAGVYWPTTAFFAAWGLWNLVYYPALGQWASFIGGMVLVAGNVAWVALAMHLQRGELLVAMSWQLLHVSDLIHHSCKPAQNARYRFALHLSIQIDLLAREVWRMGKAAS